MRNPEKMRQEVGGQDEAGAEEEDSKEIKKQIDKLPELSVSSDIIEQIGPLIKLKKDFWNLDEKIDLNLKKILSIIESSSNKFEILNQYSKERMEKTPLPDKRKVMKLLKDFKNNVFDNLQELGILPPNFSKNENLLGSEIEFDYDLESDVCQFLCNTLNKEYLATMLSKKPDKEKASYIKIGGKALCGHITKLRETLEQNGIEINKEDFLKIVLSEFFAHEYGHYIYSLYEPKDPLKNHPFMEGAGKISDDKLNLDDDSDKDGVFRERFADSIAEQLNIQLLESMGYSAETISAVRTSFNSEDGSRSLKYIELIDKGREKKYKPSDTSTLLLMIKSRLREIGYSEQADKIEHDYRKAGYYLPVFDREQLKYIMSIED